MDRRPFGSTGVTLPVIGQGTWNMELDRAGAIKALRRGLDLGMTHIDTAEMYGAGRVEEIVGEAIRGRRDEIFLVSKVLPTNASTAGTLRACEQSLKRLGTDHLDLYLLHWREQIPIADTFRAFDTLLRDGKIRHFGVSNFDVSDIEEAWAIDPRFVCNQVLYHVEERAIEHAVIPWCEKRNVAVVAYSPLAEGRFSGGRVLQEIADAHDATPRQVALAFLVRRPGVFAIPKAVRIAHVEENAAAGRLRLTDEEIRRIDRAFPSGSNRSLPMV